MINIKWKSGLILYLFLLSLLIWVNTYELYNLFSLNNIFYAILGLIPIFVYLRSLYLTEKKIEKKDYSNRWLFKYNFVLALILYFLAIIISIIFAIGCKGDMCGVLVFFVILHGLWASPLFVIIFSLLPSSVYHRYKNTKFLSILFYLSIVIFILWIAVILIMGLTCDFSNNKECISLKAAHQNNIEICRDMKDEWWRDQCFGKVAIKNRNPLFCNEIQDQEGKRYCQLNSL